MSGVRVRYARLGDRILATIWPPRRRHLRLVQKIVDLDSEAIQQERSRVFHNLTLYGNTYVMKTWDRRP